MREIAELKIEIMRLRMKYEPDAIEKEREALKKDRRPDEKQN